MRALGTNSGEEMQSFSKRSVGNLEGVHEDLVEVCKKAIELSEDFGIDFIITDGCRTLAEQRDNVAKGVSKTMHSRHLGGFAVDTVALVNGRVSYAEADMAKVAACFKRAAEKLRIPIHWGGDWKTFKDTPHIELDKERYPDVNSA